VILNTGGFIFQKIAISLHKFLVTLIANSELLNRKKKIRLPGNIHTAWLNYLDRCVFYCFWAIYRTL